MKAIRAVVESPDMSAQEKFDAVVLMAHGYGLFSAQATLNPTGYAIPEAQWNTVSGLLMTLAEDHISQVNVAMDWMNIGPSGYQP
jgi:hypothetical protein